MIKEILEKQKDKTKKEELIAKLLNKKTLYKPLLSYEILCGKAHSLHIPPLNANLTKSIFYKKIY